MSCKTSSKISANNWDLSAIYNHTRTSLHPSYKVYHNSETSSLLYLRVSLQELHFQPLGPKFSLISKLELKYQLRETDEKSKVIADSGRYYFTIEKNTDKPYYLAQIPLVTEQGKSYRLKLVLTDQLKKKSSVAFLEVEKTDELTSQYYNITDINGIPLFRNIVTDDLPIRIKYYKQDFDSLYIKYFTKDTILPKPTFSVSPTIKVKRQADSLFKVPYLNNQAFTLSYEGYYFIQFDTTTNIGVTVAKFDKGFPKVVTPEELIEPLAYITTSAEYKNLMKSANKKLSADNFWINAGGNTNRGRELIRIYYNRVYFANYYFSNINPGWKTDRGMVYIVYGPPQRLEKTASSEIWHYYRKRTTEPIKFTFNYTPTKYHLNDFTLQRAESHDWHWREAVYAWTSGELFSLD